MTAVETLEREFAAMQGVPGAVATGYGRGALLLALEAVGVRGADVAVPNFICSQVPEAVRRAGGRVVFYPVRMNTSVAPGDFRDSLTPQTRAAVVAHYFGEPHQNIAELAEICRRRSIVLVEDCALALGSSAGVTGDLATFSLTKSDWCYGGGMVTTAVRDWLARLRALRQDKFRPVERMARYYGRLRRADFTANRPSRARLAEAAGRQMQRLFARSEPALRGANFYDAAPFEVTMPEFAAQRALRIVAGLPVDLERRRRHRGEIAAGLADCDLLQLAEPPAPQRANGAFLPMLVRGGARESAERIVAGAARAGVTLRRCWPAYQEPEAGQGTEELRGLAERLLVLEIHPGLAKREVETIVDSLRSGG